MSQKKQREPIVLTIPNSLVELCTENFFGQNVVGQQQKSAIALFVENQVAINQIVSGTTSDFHRSLALLGHVSCVESYFRKIISDLVVIDPISRDKCLSYSVTYGIAWAAYTHDHLDLTSLSEALLENATFISKEHVLQNLKVFLDIKGNFPSEVESALETFEKICHLRHCIVHRFNLLGSKNAIALGFDLHSDKIGSTIRLSQQDIEDISSNCASIITIVNNYLFNSIISRYSELVDKLNIDTDAEFSQFNKYYKIFAKEVTSAEIDQHFQTYLNL